MLQMLFSHSPVWYAGQLSGIVGGGLRLESV